VTDQLRTKLAEIEDLEVALRLLQFDQQTLMPPAGSAARADAIATTSKLMHERQTAPELLELLAAAGDDDPVARVARRDTSKALRVPTELVGALAHASTAGQDAWQAAREANDFAAFRPYLERNIDLLRDYASCFADEIDEPYDALLDDFEPGMRAADVRTAFAPLRDELPSLVAAAADRPAATLSGPFPIAGQRRAVRAILERLGFDDASWTLGDSAHPFSTTIGRGDNRITTRYSEHTLESVLSSVHEFGHGLYEAQIAPELARTPLAHGCSMTLHESQSRFWEVFVCGELPFWQGAWELLAGPLDGALDELGPEGYLDAVQAVRRTPIRVEADPVSYPLHILLRFDLELALISGDLAVADLPAAWRDGVRELLGIEIADDREGALQDIHWSACSFGYFPTYALGTMLAAQLWQAARAALADLDDAIEAGELGPLREWLRERVHRYGRTYEPREQIRVALGGDLDPEPYLAFVRARAGVTGASGLV